MLFGNEAKIQWIDKGGEVKERGVPRARDVFDYPESYPEARKPGAQIKTPTTIYWYDIYGSLHHCDRGRDD